MKNINKKKCGIIPIIGKPNVGKSSLINTILNKKISIISNKKETTKDIITGINTKKFNQSIYLDTPGIILNKKKNILNNKDIITQIKNASTIIFVIERILWTTDDKLIFDKIKNENFNIFLILNKIDLIKDKKIILPFIKKIYFKYNFSEIIPVSSKKYINIKLLKKLVEKYLPISEHIYNLRQNTNYSKIFLISEIIREKFITYSKYEIPRIIKIKITYFKKHIKGFYIISALVLIENINQRKIILGLNGNNLKKINLKICYELKKILKNKVYLNFYIKINKK